MTPPNRIYIRPYSRVATEVHWRVLPYDNGDGNCVRYIKYDALMEWLEKKVSISYGVATEAFVEVIDKLNEM